MRPPAPAGERTQTHQLKPYTEGAPMNGYTPAELALRRSGVDTALLLIGLVDLEVFYRTHPGAPVPQKPTLNIRIPDSAESREDKIAAVEAVAEALGVSPVWRNGVLYAC